MSVKCTGAEFLRYYNDPNWWFSVESGNLLPGETGTYWEEAEIHVNGQLTAEYEFDPDQDIRPTDVVTLQGGVVFGKVVGRPKPSFESYFKGWRKAQNTATITVTCPKEKLDVVIAAVRAAGGTAS